MVHFHVAAEVYYIPAAHAMVVIAKTLMGGLQFPFDSRGEIGIGPPDLAGPERRGEVRRAVHLPCFEEQQIRPSPGIIRVS
jgi:hypothetical protein